MADTEGSSTDESTLDEVIVPTETAHPDHHAHAKLPRHIDDDELASRTEHEQNVVSADRDRKK